MTSTRKAVRQSPIIVRLGTDSVNSFRQQIYESLVSVAPSHRQQSRQPMRKTGGFAVNALA
jgi:hypothetical protein